MSMKTIYFPHQRAAEHFTHPELIAWLRENARFAGRHERTGEIYFFDGEHQQVGWAPSDRNGAYVRGRPEYKAMPEYVEDGLIEVVPVVFGRENDQ